jgi:hypothetical protein
VGGSDQIDHIKDVPGATKLIATPYLSPLRIQMSNIDSQQLVFIEAAINTFAANKQLAERAVAQLADEQLHVALDANTNSIAVIMKHVAGNLLSRWTDFLMSDGEKPDRHRDDEFIDTFQDRAELIDYWDRGFACLLATLRSLTPADISRTVTIRGEAHSVPLAVQRSLGHTCYHVGQIVQLARVQAGDQWDTLTIPKGKSEQFNREKWGPSAAAGES